MFWFFGRKGEVEKLKEDTKKSFESVKKDITSVIGENTSVPQIKKRSALGKIFFIASIVLIIVSFAFGGYYFWTTRVSASQSLILPQKPFFKDSPRNRAR